MNITSIVILSLSIIFGIITTLLITKIILRRVEFGPQEKIGSYFRYTSFLVGATLLLSPCLNNILYTSDILVAQNFNFSNYEFYKLVFIYYIVYYIILITIFFLSNKFATIVTTNKSEDKNLYHLITSILFIAVCFLSIPLLEVILNYYKPTVETPFYR